MLMQGLAHECPSEVIPHLHMNLRSLLVPTCAIHQTPNKPTTPTPQSSLPGGLKTSPDAIGIWVARPKIPLATALQLVGWKSQIISLGCQAGYLGCPCTYQGLSTAFFAIWLLNETSSLLPLWAFIFVGAGNHCCKINMKLVNVVYWLKRWRTGDWTKGL